MKKELPYYTINKSYGGNQDWFHDPFMKLGGCAAATACDYCIYMAMHEGKKHLYPFAVRQIDKESYMQFALRMKPYLRPRFEGIKTLPIFMDGFMKYLQDIGEQSTTVHGLSGHESVKEAIAAVRKQIDDRIPIPFLLLKHKNPSVSFFTWHWFLVVGYEEWEEEFYIKVATYGKYHWLSLHELWDTGFKEKGGMIIITTKKPDDMHFV